MLSDAVPSNIVSRQVRVWRVGGLDHILTIAQPSNGASEEPEEAPEKDELESEGGQDVRRIFSIHLLFLTRPIQDGDYADPKSTPKRRGRKTEKQKAADSSLLKKREEMDKNKVRGHTVIMRAYANLAYDRSPTQ